MDQVTFRDLKTTDLDWLISENAHYYARSDGFDESFEPLVREVLETFMRDFDPVREKSWIAQSGARRLGSLLCTCHDDQTARLKLFYLVPEARGLGLGKRMLRTSMSFARACGYRKMRVWTHESHRAAGGLYQSFGWTLDDHKSVRSFGCDLVEQSWKFEF